MISDVATLDETDPRPILRLAAADLRRLPMLGIAVGIATAATALGFLEDGTAAGVAVAVMWVVVAAIVSAVVPIANTLTLRPDGFRLRVHGVFSRFVAWGDVVSIETGDGWAGATVIVELAPAADRGVILGLPRDPTLGKRAFVDGYGLAPETLARLMEIRRAAAHP